ncbi:MAG TPA: hypothetical protein VJT50_11395, partial [Pyrinomonadaceae bacterium]|nr:hypothetical protein [Pyrinomonadaceae bacterium]
MKKQGSGKISAVLVLAFALAIAGLVRVSIAQTPPAEAQKSRSRRTETPTPTPPKKDDLPGESDEVVRVETNLTSIFFTAADNNKRFVNTLKKEDIRILEDGQPQEIFTFQTN